MKPNKSIAVTGVNVYSLPGDKDSATVKTRGRVGRHPSTLFLPHSLLHSLLPHSLLLLIAPLLPQALASTTLFSALSPQMQLSQAP